MEMCGKQPNKRIYITPTRGGIKPLTTFVKLYSALSTILLSGETVKVECKDSTTAIEVSDQLYNEICRILKSFDKNISFEIEEVGKDNLCNTEHSWEKYKNHPCNKKR